MKMQVLTLAKKLLLVLFLFGTGTFISCEAESTDEEAELFSPDTGTCPPGGC